MTVWRPAWTDSARVRDDVYGGYGIPHSDSAEYRQIVAHYDEVARRQEEKRYPQIAQELLNQLPVDPDSFLFDLAPNTVGNGRYWCHPVLASLPPADYATMVFEASPEIQSRAIEVLHSRHNGYPEPSLRPERPWIAEVKVELEKLMVTAKTITQYRLKSLIARNLDPLLAHDGAGEVAGSAAIEEIR